MGLDEVMDDLRAFVRERFEIAESDSTFDDDIHLFDYGYIDSFGAAVLTEHCESKYKIQISNDDLIMNPLNTIREIGTFLHSRVNGQA